MMSVTEPLVVNRNSRVYSDTYLNSEKFGYTWTIHNFSLQSQLDQSNLNVLSSRTFKTLYSECIISWDLKLYPAPFRGLEIIILSLIGKPSKKCQIKAEIEFCLVNENIEKSMKHIKTVSGLYEPQQKFDAMLPELTVNDSGFCPDDKLTITCDITFLMKNSDITSNHCDSILQVPECQLIDDIGALFENKELCDVKLTVNGKDFHAHKIMLAARSSVFAAMFKHEMAENVNNTVTITDINHQVFEEVLRYIYTGKISSLTDEIAAELLVAADKYVLDRLKIICEMFIGKNLTKENVTDMLIVADAHNSTLLKTQALEFISAHLKDVMNTNRFKSMRKSRPDLIEECFDALAKKLERISI